MGDKMKVYKELYKSYQKIIKTHPIILNITNYVTQDFIANALLAIGTSPIMSEDKSELIDLMHIAHCVNLNIGTLHHSFSELAFEAAILSQELCKPLVLDPVGAGSSKARTNLAYKLAPYATIIRGNTSEIIALSGLDNTTLGVESSHHDTNDARQSGRLLIEKYNNIIVISGKTDLILSNDSSFYNSYGNPIMTKITGMGCVLNAMIAAFASVNNDYSLASYLAVTFYTLCAEQAINEASTPAKFKNEFIDSLYAPDWSFIEQKLS